METLALITVLFATAVVIIAVIILRAGQVRALKMAQKMRETQAEMTGRLAQMGEAQASAHAQANLTMEQRLEAVSKRIGDGLSSHTEKTGKSIGDLHERLAVIDAAQKNLTNLSQQMVGLQDILSNKQARGAFGEIQLNDLVSSMLPPSAFQFQATLSNGKRVDCLLNLPNPPGFIAVDAKFPLESYRALNDAKGNAALVQASRTFSADIKKHIEAIASKYIIPGETAESALMFLPSESIFTELHINFQNTIEHSWKRKVLIVSPTSLMAILNTVRAVLKDANMREQAGLIQVEVTNLLKDIERMDKRIENLARHFDNVQVDIKEIQTSSKKVTTRGHRMEEIQFGEDTACNLSNSDNTSPQLLPIPGGQNKAKLPGR
ncbi:MAG: DNA recombination protein RmuC [Magnetovibrio sp.]|nr:DNA recombination protein RmuC [Magnetovibrio sp.]|tara:strand:- start:4114 stop:5247 length:1134 start_codon:yes stop_codon:yes gene_type:complete